jgi:hypothetical protein
MIRLCTSFEHDTQYDTLQRRTCPQVGCYQNDCLMPKFTSKKLDECLDFLSFLLSPKSENANATATQADMAARQQLNGVSVFVHVLYQMGSRVSGFSLASYRECDVHVTFVSFAAGAEQVHEAQRVPEAKVRIWVHWATS